MKFALLLLLCVYYVNAGFDYTMFHPTFRGTYNIPSSGIPVDFAYYHHDNTLFHFTDTLVFHINGTVNETLPTSYANSLTQFSHGTFISALISINSNETTYPYYSFLSTEISDTHNYFGFENEQLIYNKYYAYALPVTDHVNNVYRGITGPISMPVYPEDAGFRDYDEVPHTHGFNDFHSVIDGIVNNKGLCARTVSGRYVCTGTPDIVAFWDTIHENYLSDNGDLKSCVTDDDIYIMKAGNVVALRNTSLLPAKFSVGDIDSIKCTENHLVAHSSNTSKLYIIDKDMTERTVNDVGTYYTNRKQLAVEYTSGGVMITDFISADEVLANEYGGSIFMTDLSTYITNGTSLDAFNPQANVTSLSVPNAKQIISCADGIIMFIDDADGKWKLYSHGDVSDLQELLDTRIILDVVTTDNYGCMLVKLTDEHTGGDSSDADYGKTNNTAGVIDLGYYDDSTGDLIVLIISSIVLAMTLSFLAVYCVRFRS
jgi:hypothetical protein